MGYIYKITNIVNGKIYIGKTIRKAEERWRGHLYQAFGKSQDRDSYVHRAMRKYGKENFKYEIIQEASNFLLNDLERYWIQKYDAVNNGYNMTLGGDGQLKITDAELLEKWQSGQSVAEIAECTDCCIKTIGDRLHYLGISKKEIAKRGRIISAKKAQKTVHMYDLDGNYIREFESILDANTFIGIRNGVGQVLNRFNRIAGNYQWRDYKTEKIDSFIKHRPKGNTTKERRQSYKKKPVAKLAEDGTIIEKFSSISAAAKSVNTLNSNISRACQKPWKTYHGYRWKLIELGE